MSKVIKEPSTFDDWLFCLDEYSKNGKNIDVVYNSLVKGSYNGNESMKIALKEHIITSVNAFLQNATQKFTDGLNYAINFNDFSNIKKIFSNLKQDFLHLYFFNEYNFLDKEFIYELNDSLSTQVNKFINDLKCYISEVLLYSKSSDLEDLLYVFNKTKLEGNYE